MAKKNKKQSGGVNISGSSVSVGGDIVGRDKFTTQYSQTSNLEEQFDRIYRLIEQRPVDPNLEKEEVRDTVSRIEKEVKKGDEANPNKVERWLRFLAGMADDVFQVTVATLAHPVAGVAKAVQIVAQRVAQESG